MSWAWDLGFGGHVLSLARGLQGLYELGNMVRWFEG